MLQEINQVIRNRRSIFPPMYSGERIEDMVVEELLENANWAPNHRKTEPWRFHVITDDYRQVLSGFAADWYEANITGDHYSEIKHKKVRKAALLSSHIIVITMQRDPEASVPEWEEEAAVACAVQNLWLTAHAQGIGGYWSTPKYIHVIDQVIQLEEREKCLGLFYLGIPRDDISLSVERGPVEEKTKWYRK